MIAQEPHARLVIANAAHHAAHLARNHKGKQHITQPQSHRRGPEKANGNGILRHCFKTGDVLQPRQAVIAAQAAVVLKQIKRQRQCHGLGQDRQIHPRHPAAKGQPAKDQRQQPRHQDHHQQLQRETVGKGPDQRKFGAAHHAKDLRADTIGNFLWRWGYGGGQQAVAHNDFGARIHQPHANGIAADAKKRHVPQRKNAAIAPHHIHRDGHQAQAQGFAQGFHKRGRNQPRARGLGQNGDAQGKQRQRQQKPHHRRMLRQKGVAPRAAGLSGKRWHRLIPRCAAF